MFGAPCTTVMYLPPYPAHWRPALSLRDRVRETSNREAIVGWVGAGAVDRRGAVGEEDLSGAAARRRHPLILYAYDYHDARSHAERSLADPERFPNRHALLDAGARSGRALGAAVSRRRWRRPPGAASANDSRWCWRTSVPAAGTARAGGGLGAAAGARRAGAHICPGRRSFSCRRKSLSSVRSNACRGPGLQPGLRRQRPRPRTAEPAGTEPPAGAGRSRDGGAARAARGDDRWPGYGVAVHGGCGGHFRPFLRAGGID